MTFLGNVISIEEVEVDPRKMEAVKNLPRPLTPTGINFFLVLEAYYRRFMDGFVSITSPLTTLTQKSKKFECCEACEKSFQLLNNRLGSTLVLTLPEDTKSFMVYCHAS